MTSSSTKTSQNKANKSKLVSPLDLVFLSFQVYRAHAWLLVGYSAWLLIPFTGYFVLSFFPEMHPIVIGFGIVFSLIELLLTYWIGIILILVVNSILEKKIFDAAVIKQKSLELLQPTSVVLLLHLLFVLLGFILLIIPGFIALVWYAFAQTVAILDNKKGMQALTYSKTLSEGRFFPVAYRLISGPIIIGLLFSIVVAIIVSFGTSFSDLDTIKSSGDTSLPAWIDLFQSIVGIFTIPWLATYLTILYKHLQETLKPTSPEAETPVQENTPNS